ncbi:MAG: hypothetical protein ABIJ47_14365 [Candidatus Bathyarchaeota archaeon]
MVHNLAVRRRHRLNEDETPLVYGLVAWRLRVFLECRDGLEEAEALFRLLYRMDHYGPGRPGYPEPFTWSLLESYLSSEEGEP